jgi:hypothetical protein
MWALRTVFFVVIFGGGCVFALVNPIIGAITYMMVYQITPNARWWGLPLADMGFRFSFLAGLFTVLGLFTVPQRVPKAKPWLSLWEASLIALVVIATLNTFVFGIGLTPNSRLIFDKFWKMMLFLMVLNRLAGSRTNLRLILWTLVIGSLYLGHDAYSAPLRSYIQGRLQDIGGPDFRTTSGLGAHMCAMLPLIGMAFLTSRHWAFKLVALAAGAFTVNAVVLCRTRSAFIGLAVGILTAFVAAPRARRFRVHVMLVIGLLIAFNLTDVHFWERMSTMSSKESLQEDLAATHRLDIWDASRYVLADHPHGIGMGNFTHVIGQYDWRHPRRSSHNTVIIAFVELGVQGGVLFLVMAAGTLNAIRRSFKLAPLTSDPLETRLWTYGALVAFVTYFVAGLGTERLYCESFWWIMGMPHWIHRVVVNEVHASVPALALERPLPMDEADALAGPESYEGPDPTRHLPRPSYS